MVWQDEHGIRHENCAAFFKVAEDFGGLSNMHNGYPLRVNGVRIGSSEALFQACRFPHHPDIQREIIAAPHAMVAKMKAKKDGRRERFTRPDWDQVRVEVMRWCLAVKLASHPQTFAALLLSTGDRPIVERSRRDDFWGAKLIGNVLTGQNVIGQLLMALRAELRQPDPAIDFRMVAPLAIPDFGLLGKPIGAVDQQPVIECDTTFTAVQSASVERGGARYVIHGSGGLPGPRSVVSEATEGSGRRAGTAARPGLLCGW